MKKSILIITILFVLTAVLLPGAVSAKGAQDRAPQPVSVDVYNHSGAALTVLLTNKSNNRLSYLNIGTGVTNVTLMQGVYEYAVTTPCGFETGTWNVTPGRILWISCKYGTPIAVMMKGGSCADIGIYAQYDGKYLFSSWRFLQFVYGSLQEAINHVPPGFTDVHIGCWSQGSGAIYNTP